MCQCQVAARPIAWGSAFEDHLFDASGDPLSAAYSFEIGVFASGFSPNLSNIPQWAENWLVFDRAFAPDANGWNPDLRFYSGYVNHQADGTSDSPDALITDVFLQNTRVYLWAYNSKTIAPTSQWALVTDLDLAGNAYSAWLMPDPADTDPNTIEWNLQDADSAVYGGVNGTQSAGEFEVEPETYSLQTALVPEPSGALLLLVAGLVAQARRRKLAAPVRRGSNHEIQSRTHPPIS